MRDIYPRTNYEAHSRRLGYITAGPTYSYELQFYSSVGLIILRFIIPML